MKKNTLIEGRNRAVMLVLAMLIVGFIVAGCPPANQGTVNNPVTITSFSPTRGAVGTTVIIIGTNFSATPADNIVKFNNTDATVTTSAATSIPTGTSTLTVMSIVTTVPAGATTGKITVTVGGQTATSTSDFTVTATSDAPTITYFAPTGGAVGTTVAIIGTNFSGTAANNTVKFNNKEATVTASTPTSLTTTVPTGATTGRITVTVGGQTATSTSDFTVNATATVASSIRGKIYHLDGVTDCVNDFGNVGRGVLYFADATVVYHPVMSDFSGDNFACQVVGNSFGSAATKANMIAKMTETGGSISTSKKFTYTVNETAKTITIDFGGGTLVTYNYDTTTNKISITQMGNTSMYSLRF